MVMPYSYILCILSRYSLNMGISIVLYGLNLIILYIIFSFSTKVLDTVLKLLHTMYFSPDIPLIWEYQHLSIFILYIIFPLKHKGA